MCEAKQVTIQDVLFTLKNKAIEVVQSLGFKREVPTCKRIQEIEDCLYWENDVVYVAERATIANRYAVDETVDEFQSRVTTFLLALWRHPRAAHDVLSRTDDRCEIRVHLTKDNCGEIGRLKRMYITPFNQRRSRNIARIVRENRAAAIAERELVNEDNVIL